MSLVRGVIRWSGRNLVSIEQGLKSAGQEFRLYYQNPREVPTSTAYEIVAVPIGMFGRTLINIANRGLEDGEQVAGHTLEAAGHLVEDVADGVELAMSDGAVHLGNTAVHHLGEKLEEGGEELKPDDV